LDDPIIPPLRAAAADHARRTVRVFYTLTFLDNLTFTLPTWVIFGTDYLQLSYTRLIIVFSAPYLLYGALPQVPTGAWADRSGRRRAYIWGSVLWVIGQVPLLLTHNFWLLLLPTPLVAVGYALRSSSTEAIVSEVCDSHPGFDLAHVLSHSTTVSFIARSIGSPIGGALYLLDPRLPTGASTIAAATAATVAMMLPEVRRAGRSPARSLAHFVRATAVAFQSANGVWPVLGFMAGFMLLMDMVWLSYQPELKMAGIGIGAFGVIFAALSGLSALGSQLVRRTMPRRSMGTIMTVLFLALVGTATGLLFAQDWRLVLVLVPAQLAVGAVMPLANTYIASRTPAHLRATALSIVGLAWQTGSMAAFFAGSAMLDAGNIRLIFQVTMVVAAGAAALLRVASLREPAGEPLGGCAR
jgi:MFS family permease